MSSNAEALEKLSAKLRQVRRRIRQARERKGSIGEQNTKAILIEPIIEALGWALEDLDEVVREYKRKPQDKPVDYALFLQRSPQLFVEAKDLDTDLSDRKWISQVISYAAVVGVEWCVLTDGDKYHIYNALADVDVEDKLFRAVHVSDPEQEGYALETLQLLSKDKLQDIGIYWRTHFIDRHVQSALESIFEGQNGSLVRVIRKETPGLKPAEIRESLTRADVRITFPAAAEDVEPPKAKRKPTRPEKKAPRPGCRVEIAGQTYHFKYAKEIVACVANWLIEQGKLSATDCPLVLTRRGGRGQKRCLVNTRPQHPGGHAFMAPVELSNGTYIETHAGRADLERYARRLLEWAGLDPGLLKVR